MKIKLKVPFVDRRGGGSNPGEIIGVSRKIGKRLIRNGDAVEIVREEVRRVIAAVINPITLRGEAKKDWLRKEITKAGGTPKGDTIVGLVKQLRVIR